MAFPIPSHLPRRATAQDVSSKILNKIDEATNATLTASLAQTWISELDETIFLTKERIHECIHQDLPDFERQLASSQSIQTRLHSLSSNVDAVTEAISHPETGLVPILVRTLRSHGRLAQEALNASVYQETLSHLLRCKEGLTSLVSLVESGKLPEAVVACGELQKVLDSSPSALSTSQVMRDVKQKFRAVKDRSEEQLSDAYARGIAVSPNEISILPTVQVRQTSTILPLASILSSLPALSLAAHLNSLRRDLTTHFFDQVLKQPTDLDVTTPPPNTVLGNDSQKSTLKQFPAPPNTEHLPNRLKNLSIILTFLTTHLFPYLPDSQRTTFLSSLCKPITSSILNNLIIPTLPSTFDALPPYITLLQDATEFEDKFIVSLLPPGSMADKPIKEWSDGVWGHYERNRRQLVLELSRSAIVREEELVGGKPPTFVAEVSGTVTAVQGTGAEVSLGDGDADAWGFEDSDSDGSPAVEPSASTESSLASSQVSIATAPEEPEAIEEDASAWGFEDDVDELEEAAAAPVEEAVHVPAPMPPPSIEVVDDLPLEEDDPWDDPWGDAPADDIPDFPSTSNVVPASTSTSRPPAAPSILPATPAPEALAPPLTPKSPVSPKVASGLERFSAKGKGKKPLVNGHESGENGNTNHVNGNGHLDRHFSSPSPTPQPVHPSNQTLAEKRHHSNVAPLAPPPPKETYTVSSRMKEIVRILEDVLREGTNFTSSKIVPTALNSSGSPPGTLILQSAIATIDLYRALYPIKFANALKASPQFAMQFSNDCIYLSAEMGRIGSDKGLQLSGGVKDKWVECKDYLSVLGDSWFDDTVEKHRVAVDETLTSAEGFRNTADQSIYDECEAAMSKTLRDIRAVAQQWQRVLPKSKYFTSVGMVVDAALSRVMEDILALPDIPVDDSNNLKELCNIYNALEGLFQDDPEQPSLVAVYVPSWFKFSYLAELLSANLAEFTYLFEQGSLIDFSGEELAKLLRALFADTPQRANTIAKFEAGHPNQAI